MKKRLILKDADYVKIYAKKAKEDNSIFKQQKMLIESQLHSSNSLFKNAFGKGEEFKKNARKYLKDRGII